MIFYKAKRNSRKTKLILVSLLALSLVVGFFTYRYFTSEESCVISAQAGGEIPEMQDEEEIKCFNTQAEALSYISGGRIVLPDNASPEEIDAAVNRYNSEMATLEAQGNE